MDQSDAKAARASLPELQEHWRELPDSTVWQQMGGLLISRLSEEYGAKDRNHNRRVFDLLLAFVDERAHLPDHELRFIRVMRSRFAEPRAHGKTTHVPSGAMNWLSSLLSNEGKSPGYPPESETLNTLSQLS